MSVSIQTHSSYQPSFAPSEVLGIQPTQHLSIRRRQMLALPTSEGPFL